MVAFVCEHDIPTDPAKPFDASMCIVCWRAARREPSAKLRKVRVPCRDLGAKLPGQPCGSTLMRCNRHGEVTTRVVKCTGAARCCRDCPDYSPAGEAK